MFYKMNVGVALWATRKENNTNRIVSRKNVRLKHYNYANKGYYFITICTKNRKEILGKITLKELFWNKKDGTTKTILSKEGKIIEKHINNMDKKICSIRLDSYVIMPNHIHLIIELQRVKGIKYYNT